MTQRERGGKRAANVGQSSKIGTKPNKVAKPKHATEADRPSDIGLVVGIGASAGGLEAFTTFFANMPPDSGMAFVLIQHLAPSHKSMLTDLIGKATTMPVIEAETGMSIAGNTVHIIPPDATLTLMGGKLRVTRPAPPRESRRPIDTFFVSLAEDQGERAVSIVLSGTGSDGALGLTRIKELGGLTLAQAEFDHQALSGMPESAAATGFVDEVLQVEQMPARLLAHQRHLSTVAPRKDDDGTRDDAAEHLTTIATLLRAKLGHDFSNYKDKTLVRRIQRRMQVLQIDDVPAYIDRLRKEPVQLDLLFRELLIGVTQFFRDPNAFDALQAIVIPNLVEGMSADNEIRVWVPGCATGEEVYSIAILIKEAIGRRKGAPRVQIFGTDIDDRAIAAARAARYRKTAGVSAERLKRWFAGDGDEWCPVKEIRQMCVFSTHSIAKDPPFSKLDLISCRNLLIYMNAELQDRVLKTFHYALKPDGVLFLGPSEGVTRQSRLFSDRDKKHRIFERRDADVALPEVSPRASSAVAPFSTGSIAPAAGEDRIDRSARRALEKYSPVYVVVDGHHDILRFSGGEAGRYLEPSSGTASLNLFGILRKALRPMVRTALQTSLSTGEVTIHEDVPIRIDDQNRAVTVIVAPLDKSGLSVVAFSNAGLRGAGKKRDAGEPVAAGLDMLEHELHNTRTQLQATSNELETTSEEMRSATEEYQSVNEELQSSNEELETSKEEMQSINEELQTVNAEMASKNEMLMSLNGDLKNLLDSSEIATIFLDRDLRIKSFTPGMTDIFHLRETDRGRPITDITSVVGYDDLGDDARTVQRKLSVIEREVQIADRGMTFIMRIRPYRTVDNVIDGVVLTFIDISERKKADMALGASEARYRTLFEAIDQGFCIIEKVETPPGKPIDFRYVTANAAFARQSGVGGVVGKTIREAFPGEPQGWFDTFDKILKTGEPVRFESELVTQGRVLELFAFMVDDDVACRRVAAIFADITGHKKAEEAQHLLAKELNHRIKNLFAVTNGVISLSARSAGTTQDMAKAIRGRLDALARAHQLIMPALASGKDEFALGTTLDALVDTISAPYLAQEGEHAHIVVKGPKTAISGHAVTSLALTLHELATNASKYGALSTPKGRVDISWSKKNGELVLIWKERGGPTINGAPQGAGFGSQLARRSVEGQLGGKLSYDWDPEGLTVRISASMEQLIR